MINAIDITCAQGDGRDPGREGFGYDRDNMRSIAFPKPD